METIFVLLPPNTISHATFSSFRNPTLSLNHMLSSEMMLAYRQIGLRFPALNPAPDPRVGWAEIRVESPSLIDAHDYSRGFFGGHLKD